MESIVEQVVRITQTEIDSNYICTSEYVESFISKSDKLLAVAVGSAEEFEIKIVGEDIKPTSTKEVLGYIICGSYQYQEYDDYLYTDITDVLSQTEYVSKEDFPIFLFQSLAVREPYQGNGIGSALTAKASEYAHLPFFAGAWKRESEQRNVSIMEKHGQKIAEVSDYYPDDWDCPDCEGDCSCTSIFYAYNP